MPRPFPVPPVQPRALPIVLMLASACGGGAASAPPPVREPTPVPAPASPPPASRPTPTATGPTSWRFAWTPTAQRFAVRSEADIAQTGATASDRERIETGAVVTLALGPAGTGGARAIAGRVDSLRVQTSARVGGTAPPAARAGVTLRGSVAARGAVRLEADAATDLSCAGPTGAQALTALALAREVLPRVPAALAVGTRWRDTVTVASCAGPVPVAAQSVAAYEVLGGDGAFVRVQRRSTSTLRGQGYASGQSVRVDGSGSAESVLLLDPASGTLRESTGESRTTLTLTLGTATSTFEQRTRVRVTSAR